jgi:lysozyme family protein
LYEFWLPLKADQIQNQTSADSIFDFAVNSGIKTTALIVQSVVGTKTDGIIGELTLKKLNSLDFGYFQPAFTVAKITHYISIIKKRPVNKKYLFGWIIRALSFHAE